MIYDCVKIVYVSLSKQNLRFGAEPEVSFQMCTSIHEQSFLTFGDPLLLETLLLKANQPLIMLTLTTYSGSFTTTWFDKVPPIKCSWGCPRALGVVSAPSVPDTCHCAHQSWVWPGAHRSPTVQSCSILLLFLPWGLHVFCPHTHPSPPPNRVLCLHSWLSNLYAARLPWISPWFLSLGQIPLL